MSRIYGWTLICSVRWRAGPSFCCLSVPVAHHGKFDLLHDPRSVRFGGRRQGFDKSPGQQHDCRRRTGRLRKEPIVPAPLSAMPDGVLALLIGSATNETRRVMEDLISDNLQSVQTSGQLMTPMARFS